MAVVMPGQQEAAEVAVGQQGGDNTTLRRSPLRPARFGCLNRAPADDLHHRGRKPALDDMEHTPIGNAATQAAHQRRVRDRGEVVAQIRVHHLPPPVLRHVPVNPSESYFGVQPRTESILLGQ